MTKEEAKRQKINQMTDVAYRALLKDYLTEEELGYIKAIEYLNDDKIMLKIEFSEDSAIFQLQRFRIVLSNSFYLKQNILEQVKDIINVLKRGNSQEIQLYI